MGDDDAAVIRGTFLGILFPGVIDEDSPHLGRGDGIELIPALQLDRKTIEEFYIGFMDKRCWLKRVVRTLHANLFVGHSM
jgi:hypothetical protein